MLSINKIPTLCYIEYARKHNMLDHSNKNAAQKNSLQAIETQYTPVDPKRIYSYGHSSREIVLNNRQLLSFIFQYIPVLENYNNEIDPLHTVNKTFRNIAADPSVQASRPEILSEIIYRFTKKSNDNIVERLTKEFGNTHFKLINKLDLNDITNCTDELFSTLIHTFDSVRHLSVPPDPTIEKIKMLRKLQNLTSLKIYLPNPREGITTQEIRLDRIYKIFAITAMTNLTSLDISMVRISRFFITTEYNYLLSHFTKEISKMTKLTCINLSYCSVQDQNLDDLVKLQNLTVLNLTDCCDITNEGAKKITQLKWNLTELNLHGCIKITDDGIVSIAKEMDELRSLNLHYLRRITNTSIFAIEAHLPSITKLNLSRCVQLTNDVFVSFAKMVKLSSLNLRYCSKISDNVIADFKKTSSRLILAYGEDWTVGLSDPSDSDSGIEDSDDENPTVINETVD